MARRKSLAREYGESILIAVALALLIRTFVVQAYKIPSGSMKYTLTVGDHILVNKFLYGTKLPFTDMVLWRLAAPQRGDIVVFKYPEDERKDFIKRIIGLPGDEIEVRDKQVYVNGHRIEEHYAVHQDQVLLPRGAQPRDQFGPFVVPTDSYFVMGDNRDHSLDSRFWGTVRFAKLKGKAFMIYWSWDGQQRWVRWKRLGRFLH